MESGIFTRIFEVETREKSLTLYQQQVGDVSCVVWDAALVLAKYLDHLCQVEGFGDKWLEEKKVLELGAGTGCVGMTAACLGAHVVMTDLESTMPILRKNISMNEEQWRDSGTARAEVLDWESNLDLDFSPDIVLLADCVYYQKSIHPLLNTLEHLCRSSPTTLAILCQEERDTPGQIPVWKEFLVNLMSKFHLEYIPLEKQHPRYSCEDIHLIHLKPLDP
ncbi:protein-lysine methyltransferase METTL21D isoform X1 [Fopius arisanus]|uniref:Mettl21d protein n=1 Tax=Fopius arisanus TaxID=64838 RepID=A0A0C9S001_9HYME|nr:PREDICTED: protein-lysine methyltransferase METTL21D-like isoform X1 [Fopius arisanus]